MLGSIRSLCAGIRKVMRHIGAAYSKPLRRNWLSRIVRDRRQKRPNLGRTASLTSGAFFISMSKLYKMLVYLFALGKKNGDGLLLKILCFFDGAHAASS